MPSRRNQREDFSKNHFSLFSSCLAQKWNSLLWNYSSTRRAAGTLAVFLAENNHHSPRVVSSSACPQAIDSHQGRSIQYFCFLKLLLSTCLRHCHRRFLGTDESSSSYSIRGPAGWAHFHPSFMVFLSPSSLWLEFLVSTTSSGSSTAIKTLHDGNGQD